MLEIESRNDFQPSDYDHDGSLETIEKDKITFSRYALNPTTYCLLTDLPWLSN